MPWEYQLIIAPHIVLLYELPTEQAARRPDIAPVVQRYATDGWVLDGAYPAAAGAQLYFKRPRDRCTP
jgi:hypothetical protein